MTNTSQDQINTLYSLFKKGHSVTTDTRNIQKGEIFFALKGANFNGNQYAKQALGNGAIAVVIDEGEALNESYFLVQDVLSFLQAFANHHRKQLNIPVIGITGTNGKTTTKELLAAVLSTTYNTHFTKGNLNNHIGVPLTLLQLTHTHEIAIIEMGANKPGDIEELVQIAEPTIGAITNIGKAHLAGFGSLEGVIKTKSELYDFLEHHSGSILVNSLNKVLLKQVSQYSTKVISYNEASSDVEVLKTELTPLLTIDVRFGDKIIPIQTQLIGGYNSENIALACAMGYHFNVSPKHIAKAIESYTPNNNRSQLINTEKQNTLILDAYNANPTSLQNAIDSFISSSFKHRVFIIGDMLELGEESNAEHLRIINQLKNQKDVFFVGKEFFYQNGDTNALFFENVDDLCTYLQSNPIRNKSVLIKGSRGIQLEKVQKLL